MEKLRIKIGKRKNLAAEVGGVSVGGTTDHNLLKNRDMVGQHPMSAIIGLVDALNERATNESLTAEVNVALANAKESGVFDGRDGEDGYTPQKGVDYFDGEHGDPGVGILSIEQESASSTDGGENIIKITLTDGRVQRFIIKNGSGGEVEISQYDVIKALGYTPIDSANIVDNLETNIVNYPLSAAQGAKLKRLIDDIKVPTKTSQLTNDSKFMTTDEVVAKINESISGIAGGLKFEIVDAIDTSELGDSNTIYLVPSEETDSDDLQYYDEYVFIKSRGTWEKLGDTRVNLAPYYTELEVDNLIANVRKSIPTNVSQLYNDAGYVKAEDIETGEASWDSIKDNIIETLETPITWDGDTTGRETHPTYTAFYKVSDVVLTAEEAVGLRYDTTYNDNSHVIPEVGTNWLINTVDYGTYWMVVNGMICVYDESIGCSKGIYFFKGVADDGTNKEFWTNELILEADKIKPELLPDDIGSGSVSKYFETVGRDTLTWDGNTEGGYNVLGMSHHVSDAVPTLEDLQNGGQFVGLYGSNTIALPFTADGVIDAKQSGVGHGCYLIFGEGNSLPAGGVAYEPNASFTVERMGQSITLVFEKVGVYFSYDAERGYYVKGLTINGYTGFTKEVIKEEYLPKDEVSFFDLVAMGLPVVTSDGVGVETDATAILSAMKTGIVKLRVTVDTGEFGTGTFVLTATPTYFENDDGGSCFVIADILFGKIMIVVKDGAISATFTG